MNLHLDFAVGRPVLDGVPADPSTDGRFRFEGDARRGRAWLEPPVRCFGAAGRLCLFYADGACTGFSVFFDEGLAGAASVYDHPLTRAIARDSGVAARNEGRSLVRFAFPWGRLSLMYDYKTADLNLVAEIRP